MELINFVKLCELSFKGLETGRGRLEVILDIHF